MWGVGRDSNPQPRHLHWITDSRPARQVVRSRAYAWIPVVPVSRGWQFRICLSRAAPAGAITELRPAREQVLELRRAYA